MTDHSEPELNSREKLLLETARIPWKELQYFFAAGHAIYVCEELDLVSVAHHIANDDKALVESWLESGKLDNVSNDQARGWYENDALVWAVVVKPWVLIQDGDQGQNP